MGAERRKERELEHDSEARIRETQVSRVADCDRGLSHCLARPRDPLGLDVDPVQPFRRHTRLDERAQPPAVAAPGVEDAAATRDLGGGQAQQVVEDLAADGGVPGVVGGPSPLLPFATSVSGIDARN
jgi:hypothetical protein